MKRLTFTKIMMLIYSMAFIVWVTLSYILAFLGRYEIAEDLSSQVVIVGIAAILGYMAKSFFETKEEEKIKLERDLNDLFIEDSEDPEADIEENEE